MKLRLTQDGFEKYTGQMGVTFFEDGVSTTDVSTMDATRMAAVMQCEWEDGKTASVTQRLLDEANTAAPVFETTVAPEDTQADEQPADDAEPKKQWTPEELEAVADDHGIVGLRAIGEEIGVKNVSIKGLIEDILAKNDKQG